PDGKWVIFNITTRTESTNQDSVHSWLAPTDGSTAPRNLNRPNAFIGGLQWADDGRLVFSEMGKRWAIEPTMPDSAVVVPGVMLQGGRGGRGSGGSGGARTLATADDKWFAS